MRTSPTTRLSIRHCLWLAPLVLVLTVGCGGERRSPTGPSAIGGAGALLSTDGPGDAAAADAGTFDALGRGPGNGDGNGHGGGHGRDTDHDRGDDDGGDDHRGPGGGHDRFPGHGNDRPGRSHESRVVGFVSAVGADTLAVNGVVVAVAPWTLIRHGNRILTLSDIEPGDHVQARGVTEDGVLVATEIKVQDTGRDNDDREEVERRGPIAGLSPASECPVVTFMVGATMFRTSAATLFDDVTCATLANGAFVEVHGFREPDGTVLATKVDLEAGPDEVKGFVFEFPGAAGCPAATFRVGPTLSLSTRVTTTDATVFADIPCTALANGTRVEVEGTRQADGSIAAARVELE